MREIEPNYTIEIIEAEQIDNINKSRAEEAPKLDYPDEYTLRDIYRNKWRYLSSIRPIHPKISERFSSNNT